MMSASAMRELEPAEIDAVAGGLDNPVLIGLMWGLIDNPKTVEPKDPPSGPKEV